MAMALNSKFSEEHNGEETYSHYEAISEAKSLPSLWRHCGTPAVWVGGKKGAQPLNEEYLYPFGSIFLILRTP